MGNPPVLQPPGIAAPNVINTFAPAGLTGVILADYNRDNSVNESTTDPAAEYRKRLLRPGAILLANLDIDDPSRLPTPPPSDLSTVLDSKDAIINGAADAADLTNLIIGPAALNNSKATELVLSVHSADTARIRVFETFPLPGQTPITTVVLGADRDPLFTGPDTELRFTELDVYLQTLFLSASRLTPAVWKFDLQVEALTLPGDPTLAEPTDLPPPPPMTYKAQLPAGARPYSPVYPERAPAEVWFELIHRNSSGDLAAPRDTALFTIAPFMLLSNIHAPEELFVSELPENVNVVRDLEDIVSGLSGVTLTKISKTDCGGDQWVQDEFEIGYSWAPHGFKHVVLHLQRNRGLMKFVREKMAGPGIGLYIGITDGVKTKTDNFNYGGNLEVSAPVAVETPALPSDDGGPAVPKHPKALFGKILIGDRSHGPSKVKDEYRHFLQAQKAQPVLPLDTSWLDVGHVDEMLSLVRAPHKAVDGKGSKGWVMLISSADLAIQLLKRVEGVAGVTNLFRSRVPIPDTRWYWYDGVAVADVLALYAPFRKDLERPIDRGIHKDQLKLDALETRLKQGLGLTDNDYMKLPALYEPGMVDTTSAYFPGLVNLISLGEHAVMNKPWGPRLSVAAASKALNGVGGITSAMISAANLYGIRGQTYWAFASQKTADIADMFAVAEADMLSASGLPAGTVDVPADWTRLTIPEDNVDLFEAFVHVRFHSIGLKTHFVDDWDLYHVKHGELHCGTNVKRTPPEKTSAARWWDTYADLVKVPEYTP